MNSFISWIGGKKLLRDDILARLPPQYDKYIEVFGGAGWVLFRKPQDRKVEVYNDFNSNLVNLFRCVRDKPNKLKAGDPAGQFVVNFLYMIFIRHDRIKCARYFSCKFRKIYTRFVQCGHAPADRYGFDAASKGIDRKP